MQILILIIVVIIVFMIIKSSMNQSADFDDPKPMSNHHLVSCIAGQADCLEKMSATPFENQNLSSNVELIKKRRNYISRLCLELLSRNSDSEDQLKYPGATRAINVISETAEYAKELENTGINKESAAVQAVKEKLFVANGIIYPSKWEN